MIEPSLFWLAGYKAAYDDLLDRVLGLESAAGIGKLAKRHSRHRGVIRHHFQEPWDRNPKRFSAPSDLSRAEIRNGDLAAHTLVMRCISERIRVQQELSLLDFLSEGARRAGQVLPGNPPLTWEALLQAVDALAVSFDKDGNVRDPSLILTLGARRSLAASPCPDDFDNRLKEILERKRREWDARKRTRRLS